MESTNVNPTRMELRKVREKLKVAKKGHGLLKDKTSGLIKIFYKIINETRVLRKEVEQEIKNIFDGFQFSKTSLTDEEVKFLLSIANRNVKLNFGQVSHLGAVCPNIKVVSQNEEKLYYSPLSSSFQFDLESQKFLMLFPKIIKLASIEKSAYLLADEIEKCKRRTKALENVLIPQYEEQIERIELKLSGNELENTARLKTIKKKKL